MSTVSLLSHDEFRRLVGFGFSVPIQAWLATNHA
jgi:hypothetical protein